MIEVDCVVIGAGVVGIAIARALAEQNREVILLEQHQAIGTETSSRNSEVIHAGIYYPPGSLKALHCVRGREMLYEYCQARNVEHRRIGKVIVAVTPTEIQALDKYMANARLNGVKNLEYLTASMLRDLEPQVLGVKGLFSPQTGIIDSHGLMVSLLMDFEQAGGMLVKQTRVIGGNVQPTGIDLEIFDQAVSQVRARWVINCAGLHATSVARSIVGIPISHIPQTTFAIGHYYSLRGKSPFQHLVYPIAEAGGLGVHATLDLAGAVKFGPDVRWINEIDYQFNDDKKSDFVTAIARYYPAIEASNLDPAYTGIRPKIGGQDNPNVDFCIQTPRDHGIFGLINLFGIESPGLTSALSLGSAIAEIVQS